MSQEGHSLAFLGWELPGGDLAWVSEADVLAEGESMAPSFQILQPTSDPSGGRLFSFPPPRAGAFRWPLQSVCLFPGALATAL